MLKRCWFICALARAESRDGVPGIALAVDHPLAGVTYNQYPIPVAVRLDVTEGAEAARLRQDPGEFEVCYGIKDGVEQITCLCLGGDAIVIELPPIEAVHLAPSGAVVGANSVFIAWVQRHDIRVVEMGVRFKVDVFSLTSIKEPGKERGDRHAEFLSESSTKFEQGFVVIPSLVPRERALNIAGYLDEHIAVHGARYAHKFNGALGGWFISDCFRVPELSYLFDIVTADRRLTDFLAAQLGEDFHLLERSEIYIDRPVGWHSDALVGPLHQFYQAHLVDGSSYRDNHFWDTREPATATAGFNPRGTDSKIITVAVYFRDHDLDDKGLSVIPFTHSNRTEWRRVEDDQEKEDRSGFHRLRLKTRAGDAVVFDSRLIHKGMDISEANLVRDPGANHKSVISMSFGRRDAISEAFTRGFGFRSRLHYYDSDICPKRDKHGDANINWQCSIDAIRQDLFERPLTGFPLGEPWLRRDRKKRALTEGPKGSKKGN